MTELLSADQMRAREATTIATDQVSGLELMERAGRGVVEAVFETWPELSAAPYRARVLCGPGNNGGDGFVIARLLKAWGWEVEVYLYGRADKLPPDARVNCQRWQEMGEVHAWPGPDRMPDIWECSLIVDALFGTGLSRPLSFSDGFGAMLPEWDLRHAADRPRIVAVDLPSGLCSDSGRYLAESDGFWADLTVTFHREKLGHRLADGPEVCGRVVVKDIGLDRTGAIAPEGDVVRLVEVSPIGLAKGAGAHKYGHGHALVLSGGSGMTGAARLAARGALRVGAGLVTLGVPKDARAEVACQITSVMQTAVNDPADLSRVLQDARINALCLGPGLGVERARGLVEAALDADGERAVVLDADALTAFKSDPDALFARLGETCVLTPHAGEFARLFPDIAAVLATPAVKGPAYSKVDATRAAAARAGCIVLYKGADTVIAAPDGRCAIHSARYDRAAPWLATAGAGDVLAGFIVGLLARGLGPMEAAMTATWLHTECARRFGPGLIAEDLPEQLPSVLSDLGV